jgi:iron complex outermembrane receptor protein
MKTKLTPIAAAAAVALAGAIVPAMAQTAAPAPTAAASAPIVKDTMVQTVEVTGIRASMQQSLNQKRNAETHVEVITAEDMGKLPDKNVADSLQRVPGVTISSAGATEGGFDESDRVSMRGTNASLTQTLINGHNIGSGDWFALDQTATGAVGRSVSYTLLPSEVVGSVVVHKTSQASLVEGGVVGSVDILTRKPLDFKKTFTLAGSVGGVYADLPAKTDPQANILANWKNEAGTVGILAQAFFEKRHLRRDGVEELGYEQIGATSKVGLAHPDLANVWYPTSMGEALFTQERKRTGGLLDIQVKPNSAVTLDLNGFYSKLNATNYNRNFLLWNTHAIAQGNGQAPDPGYVVSTLNGVSTLTQASFSATDATSLDANGNPKPVQHGIYDMISRPGEAASTQFVDFDGDFRLNDKLKLQTKIGVSKGVGVTPRQDVLEADVTGTGGAYKLNGAGSAPSFSLPGLNTAAAPTSAHYGLDWIFGANNVKVTDNEKWQQIDAQYDADIGVLSSVKFGARANQHERDELDPINAGAKGGWDPSTWGTPGGAYPSNFAQNLGGSVPPGTWYLTPAQLSAFSAQYRNLGDGTFNTATSRNYPGFAYSVHETTNAGYVQANLEGNKWSGDVGVRLVQTNEHVLFYTPGDSNPNNPNNIPGAIDSAWGWWLPQRVNHTYNDVLPSGNLRFEITKDLIARVAASRTMTRADYTALAGSASLTPPGVDSGIGSGSAGNPNLKPITSNNLDASIEWYFADRSLLSASAFFMDLTSYVSLGHTSGTYVTQTASHPGGIPIEYSLTTPINSSAKVKGVELEFQEPIWGGLGVDTNLTFIGAKTADGAAMVGASKLTYNLSGYFENDLFSARIGWNHRSSFYSGLDRQTAFYQAAVGEVNASLNVKINKMFSVHLDARNLNNAKLKYYALNTEQPRAIYQNGRQYYLTASFEY